MRCCLARPWLSPQPLLYAATRSKTAARATRAANERKARAQAMLDALPVAEQRASMPVFSTASHVDFAGSCKAVDSINATGWTAAQRYMTHSAATAVCFQELKRRQSDCAAAEDTARGAKWSLTIGTSVATCEKGTSAGVGVAAPTFIGLGAAKVEPTTDVLRSRIKMAWLPTILRGGVHLVSVYFWTKEPLHSPRNAAILETLTQMLDNVSGPWIVAADWQNSPEHLRQTRWPEIVRGTVHAPSEPTCGTAVIDYFVAPLPPSITLSWARRY